MQAFRQPVNGVSVDDFVDLDNFLDSYLVDLAAQTDPGQNAQRGQLAQGLQQHPGVPAQMQTGQPPLMLGMAPGVQMGAGLPQGLQQQAMPNFSSAPLQSTGLQMGGMAGLGSMQGFAGLGNVGFGIQNQQLAQPAAPFAPQLAQPMMAATSAPATGRGRGGRGGGRGSGGRGGRGAGKANAKSEPDLSDSAGEDGSDGSSSDGGGEPKSRKKQNMTMDDAERRHQALQEKNRRAQRRFRERQKNKLLDLHRQIEDLTTKVSSLQSENAALHSRTSILEKVLDMRNEQIQVMQESKEAASYPGNEEELAQLQNVGGVLVQLTPEMIKELSSDQIYKIYQMYVKELSVRLVEVNKDPEVETPLSQELDSLVKDLSMMIMRLGVIKPLETRKFIVVSRQYLGSTEAEVINLWKNVMRAIDLSDQQKREVVELKRLFLHKIEPIMEERKHLNIQIQANLPHDTFHTKNALTYIKAHEAVIKLRDNLRAEQHVVLEFAIAVFRGVFRARQMATLLVKCFPAVPDALGIASALAAELGEPDSAAARHLAMQLGGYLEGANGGHSLGTNYLTLQAQMNPGIASTSAVAAPAGAPPAASSAAAPLTASSGGGAEATSSPAATGSVSAPKSPSAGAGGLPGGLGASLSGGLSGSGGLLGGLGSGSGSLGGASGNVAGRPVTSLASLLGSAGASGGLGLGAQHNPGSLLGAAGLGGPQPAAAGAGPAGMPAGGGLAGAPAGAAAAAGAVRPLGLGDPGFGHWMQRPQGLGPSAPGIPGVSQLLAIANQGLPGVQQQQQQH